MVAADQHNRNAGAVQALQLADQEQPGAVVGPVAVEDVARHHDQVHPIGDGPVHEVAEGAAAGARDVLGPLAGALAQAGERAVQVKIGGVDEAHG